MSPGDLAIARTNACSVSSYIILTEDDHEWPLEIRRGPVPRDPILVVAKMTVPNRSDGTREIIYFVSHYAVGWDYEMHYAREEIA